MDIDASDQLEYYLNSLGELGEVLIDSNEPKSVGKGLLRLTLGTIMSSKGVIFLFDSKSNLLSVLATQGLEKTNPFPPPASLGEKLKKVNHQHMIYDSSIKWIDGTLKNIIEHLKVNIILPLFHKNSHQFCIAEHFLHIHRITLKLD